MEIEKIRQLVASGISAQNIAEKFGKSKKAILKFVKANDLGPWTCKSGMIERPLPDDFLTLAPNMPRDTARKHWQCGMVTLSRWYDETDIKPAFRPSKMFVLNDEQAKAVIGLGVIEAAKILGVDRNTASKAMRAAGIVRDAIREPKSRRNILPFKPLGAPLPAKETYNRDMSATGLAIEELRKLGPVSRCDLHGKLITDGCFWRRGSSILTDGEAIKLANEIRERDAWRAKRANPGAMRVACGS